MITGENLIDSGRIQRKTGRIGYCPQFDAIVGQFTGKAFKVFKIICLGRQLLRLMARIRGVEWRRVEGCVDNVIGAVSIALYADRPSATYSGGTKRRLSLGLALIGGVDVILLDEPTTGVDPGARRSLWTILAQMKSRTALVLTSHSMDECDVLCDKLAIMINGRFQCFGSPQHLKTKYSQGYALLVKLNSVQTVQDFTRRVQEVFGAERVELKVDLLIVFSNFPLGATRHDAHVHPPTVHLGHLVDDVRPDGGDDGGGMPRNRRLFTDSVVIGADLPLLLPRKR